MTTTLAVNPLRRLTYAFVGLLAGDVVLLLFFLQNALRSRAELLASHMGEPTRQIPLALQMFAIYASFSFVGWLFVGLPMALFFPVRSIMRLSWTLRLLIGASLGPFALLVIFVLLGRGHLSFPASFTGTSLLWAYAILVSVVSFAVYVALLRRGEFAGQA